MKELLPWMPGPLGYVLLTLAIWVVPLALVPSAERAWADREREKPRGVSILPGWPIFPLIYSLPVLFLGTKSWTGIVMGALQLILMFAGLIYVIVTIIRLRNFEAPVAEVNLPDQIMPSGPETTANTRRPPKAKTPTA